ncbi:HSPB1-associated protein 1 [Ixodes scapularis]|uniref:HSPB1-associated protein 1 n=1 Tax=Ixodes scapularis TaxID=6945 RepID=UPI001C387FC8|nr:HSPB1-associated protein 1 [Ixodes scapularis]
MSEIASPPTPPPARPAPTLLRHIKQPVVFRGALSKAWKCSTWTLDVWASKTKNLSLNFRIGPRTQTEQPTWENESSYVPASIEEFNRWTGGQAHAAGELGKVDGLSQFAYSGYNYMSKVFGDLPDVLEAVDWSGFGFPGRDGRESAFWLGSAGSNTPCHQDAYGCNLVAELVGRKAWTLFPPEMSNSLYPTRIPFEESSIFSQVNLEKIDVARFPKTKLLKPYHVVLEPGDVLFVPPRWWHYVRCLDTSLSVNTWIPLTTDREHQLQEAVTRTLATLLIPCYEDEDSTWLNTNEELTTPDENLAYISKLLGPPTGEVEPAEEEGMVRDYEPTPVAQCTLEEYASSSGAQLPPESPPRKRSRFTENSGTPRARDVVNCFLHPDVVRLVAEKLKELRAPPAE